MEGCLRYGKLKKKGHVKRQYNITVSGETDIEKCMHIHTQTLKVFETVYTKPRGALEVKGRCFLLYSLACFKVFAINMH